MTNTTSQTTSAPFSSPPAAEADEAPPPPTGQPWSLTVDLDGNLLNDDSTDVGLTITLDGEIAE